MPSIQIGGLGSSLDTGSIVQAILNAERLPLLRLQRSEALVAARRAAYESLGASLRDLLAKAEAFTLTSAGSARNATYADPTKLAAAASSGAVPGTYQLRVERLATSTKATSTGAIGTAITATTAADPMAGLPLAGSISAGEVGVVVDGQLVSATIGDPATTSLQSAFDAIAAAIEGELAATDPGATVAASVAGNRVTFSISGAGSAHSVRFGVGSDTSNLATIAGLAGQSAADFGTGTTALAGTALLGVVRTTVALDSAGLAGLASATTGSLTIDGVAIGYDTTTDSLADLLTRINESAAGVVATLDRANDRIVLARKAAGPTALDVRDTSGTLAAALALAPGTTAAQAIGQSAQVSLDGRTIVSDSNTVSGAIDGVTLNLLAVGASTETLTVGVDASAIEKALSAFVSSYNALADRLASLTAHAEGQPSAPLEGDAALAGLALRLRAMVMDAPPSLSGAIRSLADVGISTGSFGAAVGTTKRLALDAAKLRTAVERDPAGVAKLLNHADGAVRPLVDRLKALTGESGPVEAGTVGADAELRRLRSGQDRLAARLEYRQRTLEAQFARLEATLARLQMSQASLGAQIASLTPREL